MTEDELFFFNERPAALPLYRALLDLMERELGDFDTAVHKTQISFSRGCGFAFVSFLPVRPARERPKDFITLTLGLGHRSESRRVDAAAEPAPGRWTHHILLAAPEEIDEEIAALLREAYAFAAAKKRRGRGQTI